MKQKVNFYSNSELNVALDVLIGQLNHGNLFYYNLHFIRLISEKNNLDVVEPMHYSADNTDVANADVQQPTNTMHNSADNTDEANTDLQQPTNTTHKSADNTDEANPDVQQPTTNIVSTGECNRLKSRKSVYNWSPHYSDAEYQNQMACPRMPNVYPPYHASSEGSDDNNF